VKMPNKMSKWITTIMVVTVVLSFLYGYNIKHLVGEWRYEPFDLKETQNIARIEKRLSVKDGTLDIFNEEKEYYVLSNKGETTKVIDENGKIILDTGIKEKYSYRAGGHLIIYNTNDTADYINIDSMQITETSYDDIEMHKSGKYMMGRTYRKISNPDETENKNVIQTADGNVLRKSEKNMWLTEDEGYAVCYLGDILQEEDDRDAGSYGLLNLKTGEFEYMSKKGESIRDRIFGYTVVDELDNRGYMLLNESYEPAMEGQLFFNISYEDGYLAGTVFEGCFASKKYNIPSDYSSILRTQVYDYKGNLIYENDELGWKMKDIEKGILIEQKMNREKDRNKYSYTRLSEGGGNNEEA